MDLPTIVHESLWLAQAHRQAFQVPIWAAVLLLIGLLCGAYFFWKFLRDD